MIMAFVLGVDFGLGLCSALVGKRWLGRIILAIAVLWPLLVVGIIDVGNACLSATIYREDCIFVETVVFSPLFLGPRLLAISVGVLAKRLVKGALT
jgi:hypothetical protein